MVQFYFVLGLVCLAAVALSGVGRPLKLSVAATCAGSDRAGPAWAGNAAGRCLWEPAPSAARISFDAFPTARLSPASASWAVMSSQPLASCLPGRPRKATAPVRPPPRSGFWQIRRHLLLLLDHAMPDEIDMCNGVPVEITFTEPVRQVTLTFAVPAKCIH